MSYKNNPFFRAPASEAAVSSTQTNTRFEDRRSKIRGTAALNGRFANETFNLQRGFIRSLTNIGQVSALQFRNIRSKRCQFQFNPTSITQNVAMREQLANMFLQDPAQFTQPVPGDTTFAFELMFDRQVEYNNEPATPSGTQGTASESNIGVLTDLRSFYEIIGQGINQDQIDLALARAQSNFRAESVDESLVDPITRTEVGEDDLVLRAREFYESNYGNNAFLIPLPVRVVFSSLYMIDGYVTSSTVTFSKFSRTYVPIQCKVSVTMQAIYVGYAKSKTFLTDNLDKARSTLVEQVKAAQEVSNSVTDFFENSPPQFTVELDTTSLNVSSFADGNWRWRSTIGKPGYFLYDVYDFTSSIAGDSEFPWGPGTNLENFKRRLNIKAQFSDQTNQELGELFNTPEGAGVQITLSFEFFVYGPNITASVFAGPISRAIPQISVIKKEITLSGKEDIDTLKSGRLVDLEISDYSQVNTNFKKNEVNTNAAVPFTVGATVIVTARIGGTQASQIRYSPSYVQFTPQQSSKPRIEIVKR